jgi:hypothetical protein
MKRSILLLAGLATLAAAPAASADTTVTPAPGARNVAFAGGYTVWAAPAATGGWKLVVRDPDGTVADANAATFGAPPDANIGSDRFAAGDRKLLAVYSRCAGTSDISGCDLYAYDLRAKTEARVDDLSTRTYSETAPAITFGTWSFVRRGGGTRKGVYVRTNSGGTRRISNVLARETQNNGSRVAYTFNSSRGGGVAIRRLSGQGPVYTPAVRQPSVPRSLALSRYQAAWLVGEQVFSTTRFAGSGGPFTPTTVAGRTIAGIDSFATGSQSLTDARFLDAEGVKAPSPSLYGSAS